MGKLERKFICVECNYSNGVQAAVIQDGIGWRGLSWWQDGGHFHPLNYHSDKIFIEWENDVECADTDPQVTMTTVAISGRGVVSVVPFDFLMDDSPVLIVNTFDYDWKKCDKLGWSHVYIGEKLVTSFENEEEAHRLVENSLKQIAEETI